MPEDALSSKKSETFLWPDILKKWDEANSAFKIMMNQVKKLQENVIQFVYGKPSNTEMLKMGDLWRSCVAAINGSVFMLEQYLHLIFEHVTLHWGKDFQGLPLFRVLLDSVAVYNDACSLLNGNNCSTDVFHLQPVILSGKCDPISRFAHRWDSKECRLRNLQINGVSGRPTASSMNLSKMLAFIAGKRARGAVLSMTWSLSPFLQCETPADLDSFALLLKECDNFVGIKDVPGLPPIDSSDRISLLDQTAEVVEFSPLKDFLKEEQDSLDCFLDELTAASRSFVLTKVGKNGEARLSRYRKLSIWLHYSEQLWKQVSYSVDEAVMWDTRWSAYHLPLCTKSVEFTKRLHSAFSVVQTHVEKSIPQCPKTDLRSSREVSAKSLREMSETDVERARSIGETLRALKEGAKVVALWRELDCLTTHAHLLAFHLKTEMDSGEIHHLLAGEKGIQHLKPFVFTLEEGAEINEEVFSRFVLLLQTLIEVTEVYSYAVEGHLWDSLTSWNIVKYLDVSQHSLPVNREMLAALCPLEKLDKKAILAGESVNAKITLSALERMEAHYKAVIRELVKTTDTSFGMFVRSCKRTCVASAEELMPKGNFWKKQHRVPRGASGYVPPLVVAVLQPVVDGLKNLSESSQSLIGQEIVKAVCHGILETILKYKLKFNFFGAMQLQQDFSCIKTWIFNHPVLSASVKDEIAANDVFLECEGVTRLLMRQRDWFNTGLVRNQVGPVSRRASHANPNNIPPEMYVIHQDLWLGLRVSSDHCLGPFCS